MSNVIKVSVLGEVKDINNKLGQVNGSLGKVGKIAKIAGGAMAAAFAGRAIVGGLKDIVGLAAEAEQNLGGAEAVFGKYADTIKQKGSQAYKTLGLSQSDYLSTANKMGSLFQGSGLSIQKSMNLTSKAMQRAGDVASVMGIDSKAAMDAVAGAAKGNFTMMDNLGVAMNATTIQAYALEKGMNFDWKTASNAEKSEVAMKMFFDRTSKYAGNWEKESKNTLAGATAAFGAQFENLKTKLGTTLLPVLTSVMVLINDHFAPAIKKVGEFLTPVIDRVKEFFNGLGGGSSVMTTIMEVFRTLGTTITTTIIPAVTSVAQYLAANLIPVFQQVWSIISGKVIPIIASVATFFYGTLVPAIMAVFSKVAGNLKPIFEQLVTTFQSKVLPAVSKLLDKFKEWMPTIQRVITVVVKIIGKVLEFASAILGKVLPPVIRFAGFLIGKLAGAIGTVIGFVIKIIGWVLDFGSAVINGGKKVGQFANTISEKIGNVVQWFKELPGKIKGALSGASTMLTDIGKNIVQGLGAGIESMYQWVRDKVNALSGWIPGWVKKRLGIASPSKVMKALGKFISQGLGKGIEEGAPAVEDAMKKVTDRITKHFDKKFKNDRKAAKAAKAAIKSIKDEAFALKQNANKQKANTAAQLEANKALEDAIKLRDDYAASVTASTVAIGNVTNLGKRQGFHGAEGGTAKDIVDDLAVKVREAQEFAALIQSLTAAGLNQTNLDQLIQAGVDGGLATARALAAGGPQAVGEVNSLTAQLQATAESLGTSTAATMHQAGVDSAQGLVNGLDSMAAQLEKASRRLARKLVRAIRKALKIKSPSRVFKEIGQYTTKGLEVGLKDTRGVERATVNISKAMQTSFKQPDLHASAQVTPKTGGNTYQIHVDVAPTADPRAVGRELVKAINAYQQDGGTRLR